MSTANDYIGRRVDLLVLHGGQTSETPELLTFALAQPSTGGTITAGLQKLAQRVYAELLQDAGSELYFPARGTRYLLDIRGGGVRTPAGLLAAFSRAAQLATRTLVNEETVDDPDDERLDRITVQSVIFSGEQVAVTFLVTSLAGESATYLMPANFSISPA